jgi:hypothetical protein
MAHISIPSSPFQNYTMNWIKTGNLTFITGFFEGKSSIPAQLPHRLLVPGPIYNAFIKRYDICGRSYKSKASTSFKEQVEQQKRNRG